MSAPEKVRLKRKRHDDPLEALVLTKGEVADDIDIDSTPQKRIRYRLVNDLAVQARRQSSSASRHGSPIKHAVRRLFHLKRLPRVASSQQHVLPSGADRAMPVFEERDLSQQVSTRAIYDGAMELDQSTQPGLSAQKRPGKNSSLGRSKDSMQDTAARRARSAAEHKHNMQALADLLHEATLQELAKIPKPTSHAKPRMSSSQSRARHERSLTPQGVTSSEDADMTDADEYVYDTYVLAPQDDTQDSIATNIGYLVIGKDDEEFWDSFIGETDGEEYEEKDEDDENAEDHYAADYPEDEDESDDEAKPSKANHARVVDDDEWDLREELSTDDEDERATSSRNARSSTVVRKWEKILYGRPAEADA